MADCVNLGIAPPRVYKVILNTIRPVQSLQILDMPCGSGEFARTLANEGAVCVASDKAPVTGYRPAIIADMNQSLPFVDETFDIVTCIEGIEHIHDPFHLIREYYRLLRPGGRLILSTPNIHNLRSRIKFFLRGTFFWFDSLSISTVRHVNVVPYFILKHILGEVGFEKLFVQQNRSIFPSLPSFVCRFMQRYFSRSTESDREHNSPLLVNAEALIISAQKEGPIG